MSIGDISAWHGPALAPPFALGGPVGRGTLKASAEDFLVDERLGFEADGGVAHVLLHVEKRERDTLAVARQLAQVAGVHPRDVGFAGLKDRLAVARQWFTVPSSRAAADWASVEGEGFRVLVAAAHSRKLRRGALSGNAFTLVLRDLEAEPQELAARLAIVAARGVPNYFGPQRFGRDGSNLESIARWVDGGRLPRGREGRAFVLSAARSLLFNAVLAERVVSGSWERLLEGECVNLDGRMSWFAAGAIDATLEERLARHDIHPTGPMAGRGDGPSAESAALEARILALYGELPERLAAEGLEAARRPLRLRPAEFQGDAGPGSLTLQFHLPPGAYATAVIREIIATDVAPTELDDA